MNAGETVPAPSLADLPTLPLTTKLSSLTKRFVKSGSTSPQKSLTSHPVSATRTPKEFLIPFPVTPKTPSTSPSRSAVDLRTPQTPQTPARQKGSGAATEPQTPTTSRRAALYERIRQKSLTSTPTGTEGAGGAESVNREKMRQLGQEELKRRCILGRLDEVAATVWA
jgi:hypothetical protein